MIRDTQRLREFEACYQREAFRNLAYEEALGIFEALWVEARQLNPDFGDDWREDLEADFALARALNGLPPANVSSIRFGLRWSASPDRWT